MIRSGMLRRTLLLVLITVLLTAMLTLVLYQAVSPYIFGNLKGEEMLPKARLLATNTTLWIHGELSQRILTSWIETSSSQWDADVWLVNIYGQTLLKTTNATNLPASLPKMLEEVIAGEEVTYQGRLSSFATRRSSEEKNKGIENGPYNQGDIGIAPAPREEATESPTSYDDIDVVVVGVPILSGGVVYGAIFMAQPMNEVVAGMRSLSNTLTLSALIAALLMTPVAYLVARSLSKPLKRMRDVALAMAGGDFAARADETNRGEIGELGGALNYLSGKLGVTIAELTVERNRLRSTLDGLSEGIVAIDADGDITHANPAVYALFDSTPHEGDLQRLTVVPVEEVWQLYDEALRTGELAAFDLTFGERILRLSLSPLLDEGERISGVVGIFRDVTEAERLEQTRRDYVANVSHELRTPLTALRALIEPLRDGLVKDEAARDRAYTVMLRETLRLSRLVSDMLELSRLQSGTLSLQKSRFDATRILREATTKYTQTAEDMGQQLVLHLPEAPLPPVLGNPDRTEQVLVTLLDNAMKYTPEDGQITLSAQVVDGHLEISVRDTGIGISPEDLPHVFERFYKADKAHQTKGTGLGLAIAREILKQLGERIWVESEPGQGSVFTFTLHIAPPLEAIEG